MTGVIIGKFYPPHRGHKFLIEHAASRVDHLTVIVCAHPSQTISGRQRADWLREIHPSVTVVVTPDDLPDEPGPWGDRTRQILGRKPDVVFTSEEYGDGYARAMECRHECVDIDRSTVPISATKVRNDPLENWEFLEPCVRAYFVKRVVLIGAESTGKTTLAEQLASHFGTVWVEEYGREYSLTKRDPWRSDDFVLIASEQQRRESLMARAANKILICDTNAFTTGIWHERYLEKRSRAVDSIGKKDRVDLYLFTLPDFPFVQDGTRDGEHIREWMSDRFLEKLAERSTPFEVIDGSREQRFFTAIQAIESLLTWARPRKGPMSLKWGEQDPFV